MPGLRIVRLVKTPTVLASTIQVTLTLVVVDQSGCIAFLLVLPALNIVGCRTGQIKVKENFKATASYYRNLSKVIVAKTRNMDQASKTAKIVNAVHCMSSTYYAYSPTQ